MKIRILIATLLALVLALTLYLILIKGLFTREWVKDYIISSIEEATHKEIRVEEMGLSLFPAPAVELRGVKVYEDGRLLFSSPRVEGKVGILSFLFIRPVVKTLLIDRPEIYIEIDGRGEGGLPAIPFGSLEVRGGRLFFRDRTVEPHVSFQMKEMDLEVKRGLLRGYRLGLTGLLGKGDRFGRVMVKGRVSDKGVLAVDGRFYTIDVEPFSPYLGGTVKGGYVDGEVSLEWEEGKGRLKGRLFSPGLDLFYIQALRLSGLDTSFKARLSKERVFVEASRLVFNGMEFWGRLEIDRARGSIDGRFRSSYLDLDSLKGYMPERLAPLKALIRGGLLEIEEVSYRGGYPDSFETFLKGLEGRISLKEAILALNGMEWKHLSGTLDYSYEEVGIRGLKASYNGSVLRDLSGTVKAPFTGNPLLEISFSGDLDLSHVPSILSLFPEGKRLSPLIETSGVAGVEGSIKGKVRDLQYRVGASLNRVGITYRPLGLKVSDVTGRVEVDREAIAFEGIRGRSDGVEFSLTRARIEGYTSERPRFRGSGTLEVDLKEALKVAHLHPDLGRWLKDIRVRKGRLALKGDVEKDKALRIRGQGTIEGGEFLVVPFGVASKVSGTFGLTEREITIGKVEIATEGSSLSIKGTVKDYMERPSLDLRGGHRIDSKDLLSILPWKGLGGEGYLKGRFSLKGRVGNLRVRGEMDLAGLAVGIPGRVYKPSDVGGKVRYSLIYRDGRVSSPGFHLEAMGATLDVKVRDLETLDIDGTILAKGLKTGDLKRLIPAILDSPGRIDGRVSIKGPLLKREALRIKGDVVVEGLSFQPSRGPSFREIGLRVHFTGKGAEVPSIRIERGRSTITGRMRVKGFSRPSVTVDISAMRWYEEDFPPNELVKRAVRAFLKGGKVKGRVAAGKGSFHGMGFSALRAQVSMERDVWTFSPFRIVLQDGLMAGTFKMAPGKEGGKVYLLDMEWEGGNMEKVIKEWLGKERVMTGRFDAKASVRWEGRNKAEHLRSLTGGIEIELRDGRIYRLFTVLSKLVGLLNPVRIITLDLPSLSKEGMAYRRIRGSFRLDRGVLYTDDLDIEGREMRIIWIGSVDIPENRIDSYMAVQPFKVVDEVLEETLGRIPLIGTIILGKDKKLLVLYYRVRGDLGHPDVKGMNIQGVGKGISERFKMLLPGVR